MRQHEWGSLVDVGHTPFLDEVCDTSDPEAFALADDLFKARQAWNASRNERPGESQKAFGDALKARGILHGPPHPKTRRTRWKGITHRQGVFLFNVPLEAPGLCVMTQEEADEIRGVLASAREEDERRELHLRLLEAV